MTSNTTSTSQIFLSVSNRTSVRIASDRALALRLGSACAAIRALLPEERLSALEGTIAAEEASIAALYPTPRAYDATASDARRVAAGKGQLSTDEHAARRASRERAIEVCLAARAVRLGAVSVAHTIAAAESTIEALRAASVQTRTPMPKAHVMAIKTAIVGAKAAAQ